MWSLSRCGCLGPAQFPQHIYTEIRIIPSWVACLAGRKSVTLHISKHPMISTYKASLGHGHVAFDSMTLHPGHLLHSKKASIQRCSLNSGLEFVNVTRNSSVIWLLKKNSGGRLITLIIRKAWWWNRFSRWWPGHVANSNLLPLPLLMWPDLSKWIKLIRT